MTLFPDAILFLEYRRAEGPVILKIYPEGFELGKQRQAITSCAFPENENTNSVYTFSVAKHFGFTWTFLYESTLYSIVIISKQYIAALYLDLLYSARNNYNKLDPIERYNKLTNLLTKWKFDQNTNSINVFYPDKEFAAPFDSNNTYYMQFDPVLLIGNYANLDEIWNMMITNKSILFLGNTAGHVSNAIFSVISLVAPLKYNEPMLVYTRLGDQRFADIISGSNFWKLVGTTNILAAERCKQFDLIVRLPPKPLSKKPAGNPRNDIQNRTIKLLSRVQSQLNRMLSIDPYSDILGKHIPSHYLGEIVPRSKNINMSSPSRFRVLTCSDLRNFQTTSMFSIWRRDIIYRRDFRESILSFLPEALVNDRSLKELKLMEASIPQILSKFCNDNHVIAVAKNHQRLIRKKIASIEANEEEDVGI